MTRTFAAALALTTALVATTSGCGGSSSSNAPEPPSVDQAVAAFEQAYQARDADAVVALCHFPFILDGTAIAEPDTLRALLQSTFTEAGEISTAELVERVVDQLEDTARVTGTFHLVDAVHGESSQPVIIHAQRYGDRWLGTGFSSER